MEVLDCVPTLFALSLFAGLLTLLCQIAVILMIVIVKLIALFSVLPVDDCNLIAIRLLRLLGLSAWLELRMDFAGIGVENGGHLKD